MESLIMFFLGGLTVSLVQLLVVLMNMRSMKAKRNPVEDKNLKISVACAQEVQKVMNSPAFLLNMSYLLRNQRNLSDI